MQKLITIAYDADTRTVVALDPETGEQLDRAIASVLFEDDHGLNAAIREAADELLTVLYDLPING